MAGTKKIDFVSVLKRLMEFRLSARISETSITPTTSISAYFTVIPSEDQKN